MSLYAFCQAFTLDQVPSHTRAILQKSLLDILGTMAGAVSNATSQTLYAYARKHYPAGEFIARLPFDGTPVNLLGAGWAGGFTADSLDAHEGHFTSKGHAGATVVPALLALVDALHAQGRLVSGRELLEALCLGYETGLRAGVALMATSPTYHASGGFSGIGVVCGGARLLGLDETSFRHALGIAEYFAARCPMMRLIDHPTMLRDAHGAGAYNGLNALLLAREGVTGAPAETLEAESASPFWSDLGHRWEIDAQYFKPWPVCRWAQPALTAMTLLLAEHPQLCAETLTSVRVETFQESSCLQGQRPTNADEAQYALAFPLAALIARGQVGPEEVTGASRDRRGGGFVGTLPGGDPLAGDRPPDQRRDLHLTDHRSPGRSGSAPDPGRHRSQVRAVRRAESHGRRSRRPEACRARSGAFARGHRGPCTALRALGSITPAHALPARNVVCDRGGLRPRLRSSALSPKPLPACLVAHQRATTALCFERRCAPNNNKSPNRLRSRPDFEDTRP